MNAFSQSVRDFMYGRSGGWKSALLIWPLSFISLAVLLGVKIRNLLFDWGWLGRKRLKAKVISVGNITVGGTGKTPWIIYLAQILSKEGLKVAVLSRGYKSALEGELAVVSDGEKILLKPDQAGDEPSLIARHCPGVPVVLGAKRTISGQYAIDHFGAEVLLLDDGFQHRHLKRDLDLVNFSSNVGLGNGMLFPAGILREPVSSLKRVDAIVLHGQSPRTELLADYFAREYPKTPVYFSQLINKALVGLRSDDRIDRKELEGKNLLAFCGIAVPESFFEPLEKLEPTRLIRREFDDHQAYNLLDIQELIELARTEGVDYIVTTEKDAIKIDPRWIDEPGEIFYWQGELELGTKAELFKSWLLKQIRS